MSIPSPPASPSVKIQPVSLHRPWIACPMPNPISQSAATPPACMPIEISPSASRLCSSGVSWTGPYWGGPYGGGPYGGGPYGWGPYGAGCPGGGGGYGCGATGGGGAAAGPAGGGAVGPGCACAMAGTTRRTNNTDTTDRM